LVILGLPFYYDASDPESFKMFKIKYGLTELSDESCTELIRNNPSIFKKLSQITENMLDQLEQEIKADEQED
jgi:hypothetical protein